MPKGPILLELSSLFWLHRAMQKKSEPGKWFLYVFLASYPLSAIAAAEDPCVNHGIYLDEPFLEPYYPAPVRTLDGGALAIYQTAGGEPLSRFTDRSFESRGNRIYRVDPYYSADSVTLWQEDLILEKEMYHSVLMDMESVFAPVSRLFPLENGDFMAVVDSYLFWAPNPGRGNFDPDSPVTVAMQAGTAAFPQDLRRFMEFLGLYDIATNTFQVLPQDLPGVSRVSEASGVYFIFPFGDPANPGSYDIATNSAPDGYGQDLSAFFAQQMALYREGVADSPRSLWNSSGNLPGEDRGSYFLMFQRIKPDGTKDPAYTTAIIPSLKNPSALYYDVAPDGSVRVLGPSSNWLNPAFTNLNDVIEAYACNRGIIALRPDGELDPQHSYQDCVGVLQARARVQLNADGTFWMLSNENLLHRQNPDGTLEKGVTLQFPEDLDVFFQDFPYIAPAFHINGDGIFVGYRPYMNSPENWAGVLKFREDGTPDSQWLYDEGATLGEQAGTVSHLLSIGAGYILILGEFDAYNGIMASGAALLDQSGLVQPLSPTALPVSFFENVSTASPNLNFAPPNHLLLAGNLDTACGNFTLLNIDLSRNRQPQISLQAESGSISLLLNKWPMKGYQLQQFDSNTGWVDIGDFLLDPTPSNIFEISINGDGLWRVLERDADQF
jgi:hypothetical protein